MRIKSFDSVAGADFSLGPGQIADVPRHIAKDLCRGGLATALDDKDQPVEFATAFAKEEAVAPRGRAKPAGKAKPGGTVGKKVGGRGSKRT